MCQTVIQRQRELPGFTTIFPPCRRTMFFSSSAAGPLFTATQKSRPLQTLSTGSICEFEKNFEKWIILDTCGIPSLELTSTSAAADAKLDEAGPVRCRFGNEVLFKSAVVARRFVSLSTFKFDWKRKMNFYVKTVTHWNIGIEIELYTHRTECLEFVQCACVAWLFVPSNGHDTWKSKRMACPVFGCRDHFTGFDLHQHWMLRIVPKVGIRICPFDAGWTAVHWSTAILCDSEHMFVWFQFSSNFVEVSTRQAISDFAHGIKHIGITVTATLLQHSQQKTVDFRTRVIVITTDNEQIKITDQTIFIL